MISFAFAGVRWRVSFVFLLAMAVFLLLDSGGFAVAFLGAAVLHEAGHLAAMSILGAPVRLVELRASGMGIVRGGKLGYGQELVILAAGAATNLVAALILLLEGSSGSQHFSAANAAVAIFQLLPLGGLDGGSILELLMVRLLGAVSGCTAARTVSIIFAVTALCLIVWLTVQFGWSMGTLLMGMLLICALLAPRSF